MKLLLDGCSATAKAGQSLLDILKENNMLSGKLSGDPLAAKIAGEVFTLNYIPVRLKDTMAERPSIRRAMAASGGVVRLLRYSDPAGKEAYARTAQFVLFLALWQLYPEARGKMNCTVGAGLFVEVIGAKNFSAESLRQQVEKVVAQDIPL